MVGAAVLSSLDVRWGNGVAAYDINLHGSVWSEVWRKASVSGNYRGATYSKAICNRRHRGIVHKDVVGVGVA